jgi:AraC-like DNA-binding protein
VYTTIHIVRAIIYNASSRGADIQRLCESAGIALTDLNEAEKKLEGTHIFKIWEESVAQTKDKYLGLHIGESSTPMILGLVGYLMRHCPTLEDAIKAYIKHQEQITGWFTYKIDFNKEEVALQFNIDKVWIRTSPHTMVQAIEMAMATILNIFFILADKPIIPLKATLGYNRRGAVAEYERVLQCPVIFSKTNVNCLVFRRKDFDLPVVSYDKSLYALFSQLLQDKEKSFLQNLSFTDKVKQILLRDFKGQAPSVEIVATHMNMGQRSFQRKLKEGGETYRSLCMQIRKEISVRLLHNSESRVTDIAKMLGYTEPAFRKAFKGWMDSTPREIREGLKSKV